MLAVFRILDKLPVAFLLNCEHRSNLWAHVTAYLLFIYVKHPNTVFFTISLMFTENTC